jgi:hypothetical protein
MNSPLEIISRTKVCAWIIPQMYSCILTSQTRIERESSSSGEAEPTAAEPAAAHRAGFNHVSLITDTALDILIFIENYLFWRLIIQWALNAGIGI